MSGISLSVYLPLSSSFHRRYYFVVVFSIKCLVVCLPAVCALQNFVGSTASRSTGIVRASTSTAGAHTVRYADAIRNAAVLYTDTSEFARFLSSSVSAQISLLYGIMLFATSIKSLHRLYHGGHLRGITYIHT